MSETGGVACTDSSKQWLVPYLKLEHGFHVVWHIALIISLGEGGEVGGWYQPNSIQLSLGQHPEVGTIKDPLRLYVLPGQELVPLCWPVYHLQQL